MNYAVALISLVLFAVGFRFARIVPVASDAFARARDAVGVIGDRDKSEDEKERAAREAAIALFGRFFAIAALTAMALAPSALFLFVAVQTGAVGEASVTDALLSPWIVAFAIAMFVMDYLVRR